MFSDITEKHKLYATANLVFMFLEIYNIAYSQYCTSTYIQKVLSVKVIDFVGYINNEI